MRIIKQTLKEYASFSQEMELNQHHKQHLLEKKKASLKIVNQTPPQQRLTFNNKYQLSLLFRALSTPRLFPDVPATDTSLVWQCQLIED